MPDPDGAKLVMQASGGRPPGTGDGRGDDLPQPRMRHDRCGGLAGRTKIAIQR